MKITIDGKEITGVKTASVITHDAEEIEEAKGLHPLDILDAVLTGYTDEEDIVNTDSREHTLVVEYADGTIEAPFTNNDYTIDRDGDEMLLSIASEVTVEE